MNDFYAFTRDSFPVTLAEVDEESLDTITYILDSAPYRYVQAVTYLAAFHTDKPGAGRDRQVVTYLAAVHTDR